MEKLPWKLTYPHRRNGRVPDRGEWVALRVQLEGKRGLCGVAPTVSDLSMLSTWRLVGD
jgi:hypothetical protein